MDGDREVDLAGAVLEHINDRASWEGRVPISRRHRGRTLEAILLAEEPEEDEQEKPRQPMRNR